MAIVKKTGFTCRDRGTKALAQLMLNGKLIPSQIVYTITAAAANVCEVELAVADKDGNVIAGVHTLDVCLSDAATGVGLTGTAASGTVQAKAASGTVLGALTVKKALRIQTLATGKFTLEITDAAKTLFYVTGSIPGLGRISVSRKLVVGDYGA